MTESPGAASHAREAKVGGVGEHSRHQGAGIIWWRARSQMGESIGEACPTMDFREQLSDAQARQHGVEPANDSVGRLVLQVANRIYRQAFRGKRGLWQFAGCGES